MQFAPVKSNHNFIIYVHPMQLRLKDSPILKYVNSIIEQTSAASILKLLFSTYFRIFFVLKIVIKVLHE